MAETFQVRGVRTGQRVGHEFAPRSGLGVRGAQRPDHDEAAVARRWALDRVGRREIDDDAVGDLLRERPHLRSQCAEEDPDVLAGRVADAERAASFAIEQRTEFEEAPSCGREAGVVCDVVPVGHDLRGGHPDPEQELCP